MNHNKLAAIRKYLGKAGSASGQDLSSRFSLSLRRVRDYLHPLGCLTSYSHKRMFYALRTTARCGQDMIWTCRRTGARFTCLSSLSALVEWHIRQSTAGLSCTELATIVGIRVELQILRISKEKGLVREKFDGEYVYFYRANDKTFRSQIARRRRASSTGSQGIESESLVDSMAVDMQRDLRIAIALLNYPQIDAKGLVEKLQGKGQRITQRNLSEFMARYDVKKKITEFEVPQLALLSVAVQLQTRLCGEGVSRGRRVITLESSVTHCPICHNLLKSWKTTEPRTIRTISWGAFWVNERLKNCPVCRAEMIFRSEVLRLVVPRRRTFAYDVMVYIGEQKFLWNKTLEAIQQMLRDDFRICMSRSLLSLYVQEFCYRFECLHYVKLAKLAQWTKEEQLGYMLHVDCSSEHKSDTVFVAYDRTSEIVLISEKVPSERMPFLAPVLRKIKAHMGEPVSTMSDMGLPILKALEDVFPDVERRICHTHFLRDVGKDILDPIYAALRDKLNQSKINARLNALERDILGTRREPDLSWFCGQRPLLRICTRERYQDLEPALVLHFVRACRKVKTVSGLGYPFDLPWLRYAEALFRCAIDVRDCLALLRQRCIQPVLLNHLADLILPFLPDGETYKELQTTIQQCLIREKQFAELRKIMRFFSSNKKGGAPLSALYGVSARQEIVSYNKALSAYRRNLRSRLSSRASAFRKHGHQVILNHVDKYWGSLVLHPSLWRALKCQVVDRTNNLPESGHRGSKQSLRKTTGRRCIRREYSNYGPYLPMISNLKNSQYVKTILGDRGKLALRFAQLDPREVEFHREKFYEAKHGKLFRAVKIVSDNALL